MKFLIVKSAALTLAFLGQAAATENTINLRGAVFAATNEDWKETAAEKRAEKRDRNSSSTRSQADEDRAQARKEQQSRNRGAENPYDDAVS
jgi:hypothetical protein